MFSDYEKHGEGTCHMACAGDSTQACGGFNAFSLYRFMDDDEEPSGGDQETPASPTPAPQKAPTPAPVRTPTAQPVAQPTSKPVAEPTSSPEAAPTAAPVARTTSAPVKPPTSSPEAAPTPAPEAKPTDAPVKPPTPSPEAAPTPAPEAKPTATPVAEPTAKPAAAPTKAPVEPDSGDGDGSFDDTQYSGEATYYGATTGGNCAYGTTVPSMYDGMIPGKSLFFFFCVCWGEGGYCKPSLTRLGLFQAMLLLRAKCWSGLIKPAFSAVGVAAFVV